MSPDDSAPSDSTTATATEPAPPAARVDHVGIAVEDVEAAEPTLCALGCERVHRETVADGSFEWATYVLGDASRIELVAPVDGESFLTTFHDVTLEVSDVDAMVAALDAAGERVVGYAVEDGWTEAFVSPRNPTGALFQLMEYHDDYGEKGADDALFVRGERLDS
jgi:methylmalonyl-CoA/ethylmalonyl-CoA epimerase